VHRDPPLMAGQPSRDIVRRLTDIVSLLTDLSRGSS
jgi:hypothetical protein